MKLFLAGHHLWYSLEVEKFDTKRQGTKRPHNRLSTRSIAMAGEF
jgi:hypothetical protein